MKKNTMMRAAGGLLALTLITSSFVGGTFAKYVTKAEGSNTARVAKFGITLETNGAAFGKAYGGNKAAEDSDVITAGTKYTVKSDVNVVAPGTKGSVELFKITADGTEVAVKVAATLDDIKQITLPADTYHDDTNQAEEFTVNNAYKPILWTLTFKTPEGADKVLVDKQSLTEVKSYLTSTLSTDYYPAGSTLGAKHIADLAGTYTLSWEWPFYESNEKDQADTYLGNEIAKQHLSANENVLTEEAFKFSITVTQID